MPNMIATLRSGKQVPFTIDDPAEGQTIQQVILKLVQASGAVGWVVDEGGNAIRMDGVDAISVRGPFE